MDDQLGVDGLPELLEEVENKIEAGQEVDCHEMVPLCPIDGTSYSADSPLLMYTTKTTDPEEQ
jgi:hypothetical protein